MTAIGIRLNLRLFLEGVEIPVVSASISSQKNTAAMASIQIPANDYALDFKPRTLVHLFCYDGYRGTPVEQAVWVAGAGIDVRQRVTKDPEQGSLVPGAYNPAPDPEMTRIDLENQNYKLIFGGEVVGVSYQKTPDTRCIALQCVDWSSYWDIAYQYQVSGMSLGGGGIKAAFTGANTTVFNDFLEGSGDIVLKLLSTPPRSYPGLKGTLLGGLMHMIEAIGGCYFGKRAVKGSNDFFSLAEMRLHLTQMIGANPNGAEDELRLLRANGFGSLFSKTLGGLGQLVTIRQVLLALQKYIFHEIVPITAPYYVPPKGDPASAQLESVPLAQDRATAALAKAAGEIRQRALELKARQESATDLEAARAQGAARGGLVRELASLSKVAVMARDKTRQAMVKSGASSVKGGLTQVEAAFETVSRQFVDVKNACRVDATNAYSLHKAGTSGAARVVSILDGIAVQMQAVLDSTYTRPSKLALGQPDPPARLLTQIYRPDVWMVAPPRCNVIFPELYSQFSYSRQFLNEVSRILLRTHEAFYGSDILFDGFYMAPSRLLGTRKGKKVGTGRVGIEPPDLSDAPAWVVKDMLDHELYTGISPAFERMSDLNLHAIRGGAIEINNAKVGYAQLACNHIFFGMRFRARELTCQGKYNPYAVLGFPLVIVDKYMTDEELGTIYSPAKAAELANLSTPLPSGERANIKELNAAQVDQAIAIMAQRPLTHYLGTPELINHSLSASSGGSTSYQMSYARTTNERTEFLGDNVGRSAKARRTRNQKIPTDVAALEPPRVGTVGIRGGKIVEVTEVTDRYTKKGVTKSKAKAKHATLLPLLVSEQGFTGRKRSGTRVPVGIEQPANAYGSEVVALANTGGRDNAARGDVLVTFRAFRILEQLGAYATKDVKLPPEDLTFPPWYGKAYRSQNIGALYADYFGVGSIVDPTVVVGAVDAKRVGEALERAIYVEFKKVFGADQMPVAGTTSTPEPSGGGVFGEPGDESEEAEDDEFVTTLGEVRARSSIADAVAEIVRIYSETRRNHYDTPSFVQNYTWRPIASLVDIFGTADLQISATGLVTAGREGFHSRSYGDFDDLRQLVGPGADGMPQTVLGLAAKPSEIASDVVDPSAKIAARMDTRKEKRLQVLRYLNALAASRGVLLG